MKRRDFLRRTGAAWAALAAPGWNEGGRSLFARDWPGYEEALVVDALAGPLQFNIPQGGLPLAESVLADVRASGITAVNLTVNRPVPLGSSKTEGTLARMAEWDAAIRAAPDTLHPVRSVAELLEAKEAGRLGLVYGFQDGVPVEDDPRLVADFHARGVRILQLTYNVRNRLGCGSLVPDDDGLTTRGREVVEAMDEVGMLVDLSHCGPRTTLDGIAASPKPVALTHTGCNAVFRHPRNKDDETLRRTAERGGVVGIFLMPFLNPAGPPTLDDAVRHLEHALRVCGEDHVGIGTDQGITPLDVSGDFAERFQAVSRQRAVAGIAAPREDTIPYVPELNHPRRMETLAEALAARGHSHRVVEKVLGANFVRLFAEVWGS